MIALLATLDTKGAEAAYATALLRGRYGREVVVVDAGTIAPPEHLTPDIGREQVMAAAGTTAAELASARRDDVMATMGRGVGRLLAELHQAGQLEGVLALGGNQGMAIAGIALRDLPFGLPKLIISTVATGNVRPHVGHSDTAMLFSVADLLGGPNSVTEPMIERAVGALVGMVDVARPFAPEPGQRVVGLTTLGNTEPAARRIHAGLASAGWEVISFHASGACGSAMEQLIDDRVLHAVVDLTPHELVGDVLGDDIYTPCRPGRLLAASRRGIPQVVAPGGLDYFVFGAPETVLPKYRDRPTHYHNPFNTNIRATAEELSVLGKEMARRLNGSVGPAVVLIPRRGWSVAGSPGGPLHDLAANQALVDVLRQELRPEILLEEIDLTINDPGFADLCLAWFERLVAQAGLPSASPQEGAARA